MPDGTFTFQFGRTSGPKVEFDWHRIDPTTGRIRAMIKDMKQGKEVHDAFLVNDISFGKSARKDETYARGVLGDSSGQIPFVQWNTSEEDRENWQGKAIVVKGIVDNYKGNLQVKVFSTEEPDLTVKIDDLLMRCPTPPEKLWEKVHAQFASAKHSTKDERVRALIDNIEEWIKEDISFNLPFTKVPGGKRMHHAYVHGLLEHTASVMQIALNLCQMNTDVTHPGIVTAGAFLHDVGKIDEYQNDGTITPAGKMKGHIAMGAQLVTECLFEWEVDEDIFDAILHIIYSHHGKAEWGSPMEPKTADALIVHTADMLDSRMWAVRNHKITGEEGWAYLPIFGHDVLVGPMAGPYEE